MDYFLHELFNIVVIIVGVPLGFFIVLMLAGSFIGNGGSGNGKPPAKTPATTNADNSSSNPLVDRILAGRRQHKENP